LLTLSEQKRAAKEASEILRARQAFVKKQFSVFSFQFSEKAFRSYLKTEN